MKQPESITTLKPCPFCGKQPNIELEDCIIPNIVAVTNCWAEKECSVVCPYCMGTVGNFTAKSKQEAAEQWNRRAS